MLCHFKGERALIAFRLTSLNQPRSFISQTWQSRKLSAYILKCIALFLHALGRLVVSVCMFVSARGEEGRGHNAPISFWAENCLWGDGAVFGPSKLKALLEDITLCMFLVEDKYISPSCSIIRADFDNQNVWVCRISGGLYILPIHEILLPFLEHAFLFSSLLVSLLVIYYVIHTYRNTSCQTVPSGSVFFFLHSCLKLIELVFVCHLCGGECLGESNWRNNLVGIFVQTPQNFSQLVPMEGRGLDRCHQMVDYHQIFSPISLQVLPTFTNWVRRVSMLSPNHCF